MSFLYPQQPPHPEPKPPKPKKGEKPKKKMPLPLHSSWFVHDPAIFRDPDSGVYFLYCTDGRMLRSDDLITWDNIGKALEEAPDFARRFTKSRAIWAPDIVKVGDEYRLYASNSSWGVQQSCIFLATSNSPQGPFVPKGIVRRTTQWTNENAIDANIITDVKSRRQYMVYGSFWGGVHILELDKQTGLAKEGPDEPGICLARRPGWADHAVEGPYIVYHYETGYYYLFVSYGSLKSDYNIRVGRSKTVTGPYEDPAGRLMTDLSDRDGSLGMMIACGYRFDDDPVGFMAPGHNSVLRDVDGEWYCVFHMRPRNFHHGEPSLLAVRKLLWTTDGWPVISPEGYAGERLQPVPRSLLVGCYERIRLVPTLPQGSDNSVRMTLMPDGEGMLADSVHLRWQSTGEHTMRVSYADETEDFFALAAWDWEAWRPTIVLTGTDCHHICVWGKKCEGRRLPHS